MNQVARAPLSFGQLSVWRSIEHLSPDRAASVNLARTWDLPDDCTVDSVRTALEVLTERHESLRTRYAESGPRGIEQVICRPARLPIATYELGVEAEERASDVTVRLAKDAIALDTVHPWRVGIVTQAGRPRHLALVIHHLAADSAAIAVANREFIGLLGGVAPADPAPRCRDVAVEQHSSAWAMRRAASLDYWKRVTEAAPPAAAGPTAISTARWATLRSMPVTIGTERLAARLNISAQSVLYAAYCRTLADSMQQDRFLVGLLASNRVATRWRNLVSSMNQLVPVLVRMRPGEDFASLATRLYAESLAAYRYGCYDVDALAQIEARTGYNGAGRGFHSFFNFIPSAEGAVSPPVDSEDPDAWTVTTRDHGRDNGFPFYLVIDGGRPVVCTLRVGSAPDYEPLRDFLLRLQQLIVTAAMRE
ncbi:condensation domain-containing protein [Micromonospora sp. CA-263727]|uniref:condensation domain-containing protein n=1 Tax=Micromonospora sp. CA-263727 TaxID=3239967 RepID=UPI003D8A499A